MEPLICPQCGGQITDYTPGATFATCGYCSTRFLIEHAQTVPPKPTIDAPSFDSPAEAVPPWPRVLAVTLTLISVVGFIGLASLKTSKTTPSRSSAATSTPSPRTTVTPAPDTATLRFGGTGIENGQFSRADSIAVDDKGRIYVSDDRLRVQQFDPQGKFLKLLKAPFKGSVYDSADSIHKIEVDRDGKVYVALGGVILVYGDNWSAPQRTFHVAPDYTQDFDLRPDGSMLAISDNDAVETLMFVSKTGAITRRLRGFHTNGIGTTPSPTDTALASIRLAADSKGNIFSIYALGALRSYSLNYEQAELAVARFTPDVKFVNKFAPTKDVTALACDKSDRLYVAAGATISVYDADGNQLATWSAPSDVEAFTVDKDGNLYVVNSDTVAKYPPIL